LRLGIYLSKKSFIARGTLGNGIDKLMEHARHKDKRGFYRPIDDKLNYPEVPAPQK
jgi:hypothetical protein